MVARFRYPGARAENGYSGGLTPAIQRSTAMKSTMSYARPEDRGPAFGRLNWDAPATVYQLSWTALSHEEAADIIRQWDDAERGSQRLSWTPDDRSMPIDVLMVGRPEVVYQNGAIASVTLVLEEQR
jgi:hypothetical protein